MSLTKKLSIAFIFIAYIVACVILFFQHMDFEQTVYDTGHIKKTNLHGPLMLGGMMFMGIGVIIFRLLAGVKTRLVKYGHLVCHTTAGALFIYGYIVCDDYKENYVTAQMIFMNLTKTKDRIMHVTSFAHITVGYLFLACIILQYFCALCMFVVLYESKKMRLYFAPFHDIIGIWLFLCFVGTYLTGIYFLYESHLGFMHSTVAEDTHGVMHMLTIPAYVCFLIVIAVDFNPYFEWQLTGPL